MNTRYQEEPLVPPIPKNFGCIEQIWESDYNKEMDMLTFRVFFDTGEESMISIKSKTIKDIISNKIKNKQYSNVQL